MRATWHYFGLMAISALAGCRYGEMYDQPKYTTFDASTFFDNGMSARPLELGVVPRSEIAGSQLDQTFLTGRDRDGSFVDQLPMPLDRGVFERGQNRFRIFCAPCHGLDGAGHGPIVERGFSPPPALFESKVREQPLGYYFDVITHGHGVMYGYAARVPVVDRWAITSYLRALQLSQHAMPGDLPATDRDALRSLETSSEEPDGASDREARP